MHRDWLVGGQLRRLKLAVNGSCNIPTQQPAQELASLPASLAASAAVSPVFFFLFLHGGGQMSLKWIDLSATTRKRAKEKLSPNYTRSLTNREVEISDENKDKVYAPNFVGYFIKPLKLCEFFEDSN